MRPSLHPDKLMSGSSADASWSPNLYAKPLTRVSMTSVVAAEFDWKQMSAFGGILLLHYAALKGLQPARSAKVHAADAVAVEGEAASRCCCCSICREACSSDLSAQISEGRCCIS